MRTLKHSYWIMLLALALGAIVYARGLNGPFLFDDLIHITQNQWVKIDSLSWPNLVRAWNSSFNAFPDNRPLAQLTFGVNHALAGLSPWAFKATNLGIHLLTGVLVFVFIRLVLRAIGEQPADARQDDIVAALVATVWLLHPIHVSTVLYAVQRMAELSSLGLLAALSCYFWGRIRIAEGRPGAAWMLAAVPVALLAFFAKENAALLPLLLLVSELTVLRKLQTTGRRSFVRVVWVMLIAVPLIAGVIYLVTHPALLAYGGRPFSLEERVLTQPRVLWLYLRWLFVPDASAFGLFHDDIAVSTSLTEPPSTLLAILALFGVIVAAFWLRRRATVFSFAVLFFLASHALESSVLPLEMVFEHRNYLASVGPILLLVHLTVVGAQKLEVARTARVLGVLLLVSYVAVTHIRVGNWSSYRNFMLSSAENHPASPRSNFLAAQVLISALPPVGGKAPELADDARTFLHRGLAADPRCINFLFGLIVLDLHLHKKPDAAVVERLANALRSGHVGPTKVSITQFSFLVKWRRSGGTELADSDLQSIFDAALANPKFSRTGRAGIASSYREYYEFVLQDLRTALTYAQLSVDAWPEQWSYHMQLVRVLQKLGRIDEAQTALKNAAHLASNESQQQEMAGLRTRLAANSQP